MVGLENLGIDSTCKPARHDDQMVILSRDNKHIILDTMTTRWICCDQDVLDLYMKCDGSKSVADLARETHHEMTSTVLQNLHKLGLVSMPAERDIRKPPDWPDRLELDIAVLKLTWRCNLSCRYCYADCGQLGQDMPLKVARKIIDRIFELPQNRVGIQWGGGEPLLAFPVIQETAKYALRKAKQSGKEVKFVMQTNGTLLDRHLEKRLRKLKTGFGVSLDGPEEINDQTRVFGDGTSSYKQVENSMRNLNSMPACIVTLTRANAPHIEEIVRHFAQLGIRTLKINPCRPLGRGQINRDICLDPLSFADYKIRAMEEILRLRKSGFGIRIPGNTEVIVRNLLNSSRKNANCYSSPSCGAGMRMLGIDVNGDVYPCEELTGVRAYLCGNLLEQSLDDIFSNSSTISRLRARTVYNLAKCRECMWRHFCGGGCASAAAGEYGDIMREDPHCEFRKKYFEYMLWKLALSQPRDWTEP